MALLEVEGLEAQYGWTKVLHGIRFEVEDGGITTILGANGAGKTTTLRAVCGMVRTAGEIRFDGRRLAGRATEDIVRLGIAHVPEGRGTFMQLTVEENLRLGAYARREKGASSSRARTASSPRSSWATSRRTSARKCSSPSRSRSSSRTAAFRRRRGTTFTSCMCGAGASSFSSPPERPRQSN